MGVFKADHQGLEAILKSGEVQDMVDQAAGAVAGNIRAAHPDLEPAVHSYKTDRSAASISVANGMALQAKEGLFTRAASAEGIEVRSR